MSESKQQTIDIHPPPQDTDSQTTIPQQKQSQIFSKELVVDDAGNKEKIPTEPEKQKEKEKDKTVVLTIKEMNKIRKQLEKLETIKKENEELTQYISGLQKKLAQGKKNETSRQAREETIRHLQKMVDQSSKNEEKAKKEQAKYREIYKHEKQMSNSLKVEVQQLRRVSSEYFLLKQQVSRLNNECISLRQARDQYPIIMKKNQQLDSNCIKLNQKLEQQIKDLLAQKQLRQKLQTKLQSLIQSSKQLTKEKNRILCDKQELTGELQALTQQIEDERMEYLVRQKKTNNKQIKQLKVTLHQEHEKLKITEHQLEQARKNARKTVDLDKVKLSSLGKQDLFNLLQESQIKIVSFKMALNDAGQKIQQLNDILKQKDKAVMTLARQLTKDYPDLNQSEGMDYIQKDILQMGKMRKDDWGEIVEKVMIENLRLKSSVTALGEEYNQMMRVDNKK